MYETVRFMKYREGAVIIKKQISWQGTQTIF